MSKVTDPDNLDRFQIAIDPVAQTISVRGLGTERHAVDSTGDSDGTTTFTDAGANFTTDGVVAGDVLTIISDPAEDGGIIGHYRVISRATTTLVADRSIPASTAADLTYKINAKQTPGASTPQVSDGVVGDVLHSFFKEEWITLAAGLGNAVDLNKFTYPMRAVPVTVGQYIFGGINGDATSAWTFAANNGVEASDVEGQPIELMRDVGWQERDAADVVLRELANYTTLGAFDADAQATYQQGDETGDPVDFKLTGPVNQAVVTFGPDSVIATLDFAATTITRGAGDWTTENYRLGDRITIRNAEDGPNDGNFGPITSISATVITIASASFTVNAADTTAIVQVDHRQFTALRGRKKGRTYAKSLHADAGVATTGILPQVNKFPLAHGADPAIVDDDGVVAGGDGTANGDFFQEVETHTALADGVTTDNGDGTFGFASAGATFNSLARAIILLQPGDSLEITSGGYQGVYEIKSVDGANDVTLYHEPTRTYPGDESTLAYTARTGVTDNGHTNAVLADVDGATGTLTSATSTFDVDTAIGDRLVVAGDIVEVHAGTAGVIGYYKVISVDSATVLTLNTSDQIFAGETAQSYRIWRPGMFLQRFETTVTAASMTNMAFGDDNPDTMTRTGGSWVTDGFVANMAVIVADAEDAGNIRGFVIGDAAPSATVATLIASEVVVANAADTVALNGQVTGDIGIVRAINAVNYPFHWRLFANGGTQAQVHQFLRHLQRREYDIDGGNGVERGDITDDLMEFVSPNGITLDLFPDDLAGAELYNVKYRDISGAFLTATESVGARDRSNAFLVGLTFVPNADLINSALHRLTMYFTSVPSGSFDANDGIIIDDDVSVDMDFTVIAGNIQATYDYTNNAQGGRTPDTDAPFTLVAYGTNLAQALLLTGTITKVNALTIQVSPPTEFNYKT
jgi:hypothetical protein